MSVPDFNLLLTLDAVLSEGSVVRAAKRLHLSPSAMSRALARVREATGDPLLVRAGRGLVPTPRALALREPVRLLVQETEAVLRPVDQPDLASVVRTFTVRTREGFVENFGPTLIARVHAVAPRLRLHFMSKLDRDSSHMRDGEVDLETGVVGSETSPEIRSQSLFRDRFVGVVRIGHGLSRGKVTPARYAAGRHIGVTRKELDQGPIFTGLSRHGLQRDFATIVSSFSAALALARSSDLIASVPERHTGNLRDGLHTFLLPVPAPEFTVSLLWHPRMHADPVHAWLRSVIMEVCAAA
jgi:DNA-binding transcriptional LysR family regulator